MINFLEKDCEWINNNQILMIFAHINVMTVTNLKLIRQNNIILKLLNGMQ